MIILGGSNSAGLASGVSKELGAGLADFEKGVFPDGEIYLRVLSKVEGEECVVIQSTPDNDALVELMLILDLLQDLGAAKVHAVVPYLGYSRQDKRFHEGEALSAKTVLKLVDSLSDSVITVNCHFLDKGGESEFQGIRLGNLDAFPELARYFKGRVKAPFLLAPDRGSLALVENAARDIDCGFDFVEKERVSGEEVETEDKPLDVEGKDVIILDDTISTGGTIIGAAGLARDKGASSVQAGCVHGIFSKGLGELRSSVGEVVCTDSVQGEASRVSVAGLIAKGLE